MGRIFMTGAESESTPVWDFVSGLTVSTVQKRTGAASFYMTYMQYAWKQFANKTELYIRMGIYTTGHGTDNPYDLFTLLDSAGAAQFGICSNAMYAIMAYRGGYAGTWLGTGSAPLLLNQWQCLELYLKIHDTDGLVTIKLDGTTILTLSGVLDTKQTANAGVNYLKIGSSTGTYNYPTQYIDDIAINDVAGAVNNSWVGRGGIYGIVSEGVGTYTDLIASAPPAWDCINEVPPSDADYVYESTVDKKSVYALTALVPTIGTISCINVIMRAKLDAVGTGNIARLIRSNGVDSQGADVGLDTSPKTITEIIETDPGQAPGTPWTIPAVNAMQAGATVR